MSSRTSLFSYGNLRMSLRKRLQQHPELIGVVRALRAIWVLGPWQNLLIRYHQKLSANPPLPRQSQSLFDKLDVAKAVADLTLKGVACGLHVPQQQVSDILRFCDLHPRNSHSNPHLACETLNQIILDPKVLEVASQYLGAEPVLYQTSLYWSLPPTDEETLKKKFQTKPHFHYDIGDYRSLVLFIYLTDVDEQCGPHIVIEGTHRKKTFRQLLTRFLSDEKAYRRYSERIKVIQGVSGEGFFEDLTCYHKRSAATKKRLMLTVSYMLQRTPLTDSAAMSSQLSDSEESIARLVQTS